MLKPLGPPKTAEQQEKEDAAFKKSVDEYNEKWKPTPEQQEKFDREFEERMSRKSKMAGSSQFHADHEYVNGKWIEV